MSTTEICWLAIGFGGQIAFTGRFLVQWIASERRRDSVIPLAFWYLSLVGGLMLLAYAFYRQDPVIISGQLFGCVIYGRNLFLIYRYRYGMFGGTKRMTADPPTRLTNYVVADRQSQSREDSVLIPVTARPAEAAADRKAA